LDCFSPKIAFLKSLGIIAFTTNDYWWVDGGIMNSKQELEELKYEYEKALRVKASLEKNYDRRRKLNLLDSSEENSIKDDLREASRQIDDLRMKVRRLESQHTRAKIISESSEKSPWA